MKSPAQASLTFNSEILDRLFPFHLLINHELKIEACGRSMLKLVKHCRGHIFTDCFTLMRPMEPIVSFTILQAMVNKLVVITSNDDDAPNTFRGQFEYFQTEEKLLFTGAPLFDTLEQLKMNNISVNDFAHYDPTIDLLNSIKTTEITNYDLQHLLLTINEQNEKLRKSEEHILDLLHKERDLYRLKSNFVNLVSHEFRTPLACIRSSVELMQISAIRAAQYSPAIARHEKNILSELDRLSDLIDEVLTVGKSESEAFACKKEPIDLKAFTKKIVEKISTIQTDGRTVLIEEQGDAVPIPADPLLLSHILTNLLSNALKYSQGCPQPVATLIYTRHQVQVKVNDYGMGIPVNEQHKVFEAFNRGENVQHIQGSGLGLFIAKNFVEIQGGQISLNSTPAVGTEFLVTLPIR